VAVAGATEDPVNNYLSRSARSRCSVADRPPLRSVAHVLNTGREQEIAASVGAHRDLGGGYDDAIAAGLV
jgi:hypothetical protein